MPQINAHPVHPDFLKFADMELQSCDFDAEHPVIIEHVRAEGLETREALWLCFLYMAFYDEASAWVTFANTEPFTVPADQYLKLPIGKNRRNLYGASIKRHFESLVATSAQYSHWPLNFVIGARDENISNWELLKQRISSVWGNGRFATFTTAELIQKACGLRQTVIINGLDNKGSSGPADGIARAFYCDRGNIAELDRLGEYGYNLLSRKQMKPTYTELDLGVVESIYCTFGATCRGKFYPGRNIDRQQQRILTVEQITGEELTSLWNLREKTINKKFLGEFSGWTGIDKERLKAYRDRGELLWHYENR